MRRASANELFPLLLFIGIGAMIDFGPLLANPKLMIFGAAAQFGIFFTLCGRPLHVASTGTTRPPSPSSARPTAPPPSSWRRQLALRLRAAPSWSAAYSYMALVPMIQPPVIKADNFTQKERLIRMTYQAGRCIARPPSILFPIVVTVVAGLVAPGFGLH